MRLNVLTIPDVVRRDLCCGCGACAAVDPSIEMVDDAANGLRPRVTGPGVGREAVAVCPGVGLAHEDAARRAPGVIASLYPAFGPVVGLWEGWSGDEDIRFCGSSGGAATALALHCLTDEGMSGVLHTGAREDRPYLNETVWSSTREELLARTGSRYAPASPCDGLGRIESAPTPGVFIGKPCDVAAAQKARRLRPALDRKLGVTIAFFCAGTPSTNGTLEMLRRLGIDDPEALTSLRYRGRGWPGLARAVWRGPDGAERTGTLTYDQAWGEVLTAHQQWRCKVCADHTGEFADIAVGDPWHRKVEPGEAGSSLILARTPHGRAIIERAIESGALVAERVGAEILPASQPNLVATRGSVWGRIVGSRLSLASAPTYRNMPMFSLWRSELSLREKTRSILGTMRRVWKRRLARSAATQPGPAASAPIARPAVREAS